MKFNILYILFPAALACCYWIARDFKGQSANSFFGMAETEPQILNFDHDIAVREVFVKIGDNVRKGDTLAVFYRAELDHTELARRGELTETETERAAEYTLLEKEKALILARQRAKNTELDGQIRLLRTEDSLKTVFRKNIYEQQATPENKLVAEKITALQQEKAMLAAQTSEELRLLELRQKANDAIAGAKTGRSRSELEYLRAERDKLLLIAPMDGYVEDIFFGPHSLVPAHRDLLKINPKVPNKVIGFIYETAEVPFNLGQTVTLASFNRPNIKAEGKIIGSNPKMTELPLRLRKFIELRSWGREVYIQLPDTNRFFISEKIAISLPVAPAQ